MQVDLSKTFYDLFGLPLSFDIDEQQLVSQFRELQKQLHPDRFAAKPASERRWSMQAASFVNEGYQTLRKDLARAVYLLSLNGVSVDEETDTHMAPEFLMQQMEYRESLEAVESAAQPESGLDTLRSQLKSDLGDQRSRFSKAAEQQDWQSGRSIVRQWQFLDKLSREVKNLEERLDA